MNGVELDKKPAAPASVVDAEIIAAAAADKPAAAEVAPATNDRSPGDQPAASPPIARLIDYDAEAREVMEFAAALFFPLRPALAQVYTPIVRERVAAAAAPLLRKYNIDLSMLGPELTFAVVIIPLIAPTVAALKAKPAAAQQPGATNDEKISNVQKTATAPGGDNNGIEKTADNPLARFPTLEGNAGAGGSFKT